MACGSCGQRRQIMSEAAKKIIQGKNISPQAQAFKQTVVKDVAAIKRLMIPRGR